MNYEKLGFSKRDIEILKLEDSNKLKEGSFLSNCVKAVRPDIVYWENELEK